MNDVSSPRATIDRDGNIVGLTRYDWARLAQVGGEVEVAFEVSRSAATKTHHDGYTIEPVLVEYAVSMLTIRSADPMSTNPTMNKLDVMDLISAEYHRVKGAIDARVKP